MVLSQKTHLLDQEQEQPVVTQHDIDVFSKLNVRDFKILRRFYFTGKQYPNDVALYTVSILHAELSRLKIKYGLEGLRSRLEMFVSLGLLDKIKSSPCFYNPVRNTNELKRKFEYFFENFFKDTDG